MSATATSILAYNQIRESGALTRARFLVYEALCLKGALTGNEVDKLLHSTSAHKRLAELGELGVAEVTRERYCTVTGRLCAEWRAVDRLPVGAITKTQKRSREDLEAENAELRAELDRLKRRLQKQMSLWEANQ